MEHPALVDREEPQKTRCSSRSCSATDRKEHDLARPGKVGLIDSFPNSSIPPRVSTEAQIPRN
jgi:hypothetical protein